MTDDCKTLLVLGANGKVGTMLRRYWVAHPPSGWRVLWQSRTPPAEIIYSDGSFPDIHADAVFSLWGVTPHPQADYPQNISRALHADALARHVGAKRILHCSSSAVYGGQSGICREQDYVHPSHPYGQSKLDMELALTTLPPTIDRVILRIANIVGTDALFSALATGAVTLDQFYDGTTPLRGYLTIEAMASVIIALISYWGAIPYEVINISPKKRVHMGDLVQAAKVKTTFRPAPSTALKDVWLDTQRLARYLDVDQLNATPQTMIQSWQNWRPSS